MCVRWTIFLEVEGAIYHVHHLQAFQQLTVPVFEAMGLVNDDTAPWYTAQLWAISQDHLKCSDDGMEFVGSLNRLALWE